MREMQLWDAIVTSNKIFLTYHLNVWSQNLCDLIVFTVSSCTKDGFKSSCQSIKVSIKILSICSFCLSFHGTFRTNNVTVFCSFRKADKLKEKIQVNKDLLTDNETWLTQQQLQVGILFQQAS